MIDAATLLSDTRKTVIDLVDDLRKVAANDPAARAHVADEYQRAHAAGRTALGQAEWAEGLYAQVAVAWTLGCVFVRFCEDNGLITEPLLGGPGLRTQLALDQRAAHLHANPAHDDRHWLREVFICLRALPATGDVFGSHNPIWLEGLLPSADGARRLREDLTRIDPSTGQLRHDFTDPSWDTRFLGDLYQDLSDHAKKTYALLQTPVFVEEFILDRTLGPAISTFGLAATTIIDPTCGSGHFLLGAFARLFDHWVELEPGTSCRVIAQRALDAIGGIDLNPFAASIARFRLLLAAMRAGGDAQLVNAPAYDINIAVGDSLLHGDPPGALPGMHIPGEEEALLADHGYSAEDHAAARELLSKTWSAVVGNPPYIVVSDPALNRAYRKRFKTCHKHYSLGVPFTERFFQLAQSSAPDHAGFVGMITADSFAQRDFGKPLVERFLSSVDLTHVISLSVVPVPGHGTPTVILLGRSRSPVHTTVRQLLGVAGAHDPDPEAPWTEMLDLVERPGGKGRFLICSDTPRDQLARHPWILEGGGVGALKEALDGTAGSRLADHVVEIGRTTHTGEDSVYYMTRAAAARRGIRNIVAVATGSSIRDWRVDSEEVCVFTYDLVDGTPIEPAAATFQHLWKYRTTLRARLNFGQTNEERGLRWFDQTMFFPQRYRAQGWIGYAHVATHNHFALVAERTVFDRTAPALVLDAEHVSSHALGQLLALLNSSLSCFWMKQACYPKGGDQVGGSGARVRKTWWDERYNFDSSRLRDMPVPGLPDPSTAGRAVQAARDYESAFHALRSDIASSDDQLQSSTQAALERFVTAQEELDWEVYRLFGLVESDLVSTTQAPPLCPGERAFEIALARRVGAGLEETAWFQRHGVVPRQQLPDHWAPAYAELVERRIATIEGNSAIGLVERPECKRRWYMDTLKAKRHEALRDWLLTRLETSRYWPAPPQITTTARLAAEARIDSEFVDVSRRLVGRDDVDIAALINDLVSGEAVAYLSSLRYSEQGLRKHREWLKTWELQRVEDAQGDSAAIAPPPRYGKGDYTGAGWDHRGKLDIPSERFIVYPGGERETDASAVIGWAGWGDLERARALAAWYLQAKRDGRDKAHLTPLLAGLAELVPWLKQWYNEPSSDPSLDRPGSQVAALVDTELRSLGLTHDDLAAWRPTATVKRGRPRKASA